KQTTTREVHWIYRVTCSRTLRGYYTVCRWRRMVAAGFSRNDHLETARPCGDGLASGGAWAQSKCPRRAVGRGHPLFNSSDVQFFRWPARRVFGTKVRPEAARLRVAG